MLKRLVQIVIYICIFEPFRYRYKPLCYTIHPSTTLKWIYLLKICLHQVILLFKFLLYQNNQLWRILASENHSVEDKIIQRNKRWIKKTTKGILKQRSKTNQFLSSISIHWYPLKKPLYRSFNSTWKVSINKQCISSFFTERFMQHSISIIDSS